MKTGALLLVACAWLGVACGNEEPDEAASSSAQVTTEMAVTLPANDPCHAVLRPLAEGVAASTGLKAIGGVGVSLLEQSGERVYDVLVHGVDAQDGAAEHHFTIVLSNAATSRCWVTAVEPA